MDIKEQLRQYQNESIAKRQAELDKSQQEHEEYLQSEQYLKDQWEAQEERWAKSFAKKGLVYHKKPFVSELEKQQMAEQAKEEKIAFLKAKLKELEGE